MVERKRWTSAATSWLAATILSVGSAAGAALLLVPLLAAECGETGSGGGGVVTNETFPDDVKTIEDFADCLNTLFEPNEIVDISRAVECLPCGCSMTVTMSRASAQRACFMGGTGDPNPPPGVDPADTMGGVARCQLPRVIFHCAGPPALMPSFSLCPLGSVAGGVQGSNRVEIGEVMDCDENMRMADVPLPPGPYTPFNPPGSVVSKVDGGQGTKACNECHGNPQQNPPNGADEISDPIDPFTRNPECVTCTDRPGKAAAPGNCQPKASPPAARPVTGPTNGSCLSEICDCIDTALAEDDADNPHPLDTPQGLILQTLCRALQAYQEDRGICSDAECPEPTGPSCDLEDEACCGITGDSDAEPTGYTCQTVGPDDMQCLPEATCHDYSNSGGGKFLVNAAVAMVRLDLAGSVATGEVSSFADFTDVTGTLSVFDYTTRTLVEATSFSTFGATVSGADFSATGTAYGTVNGVPTNLAFDAEETGGVVTFEVRNADTLVTLAEGTGETGRADFELTVAP